MKFVNTLKNTNVFYAVAAEAEAEGATSALAVFPVPALEKGLAALLADNPEPEIPDDSKDGARRVLVFAWIKTHNKNINQLKELATAYPILATDVANQVAKVERIVLGVSERCAAIYGGSSEAQIIQIANDAHRAGVKNDTGNSTKWAQWSTILRPYWGKTAHAGLAKSLAGAADRFNVTVEKAQEKGLLKDKVKSASFEKFVAKVVTADKE